MIEQNKVIKISLKSNLELMDHEYNSMIKELLALASGEDPIETTEYNGFAYRKVYTVKINLDISEDNDCLSQETNAVYDILLELHRHRYIPQEGFELLRPSFFEISVDCDVIEIIQYANELNQQYLRDAITVMDVALSQQLQTMKNQSAYIETLYSFIQKTSIAGVVKNYQKLIEDLSEQGIINDFDYELNTQDIH